MVQVVSTTTFDTLFTHVFLFPGMLEMFSTLAHRSRIPEARSFQVHDSGFLCIALPAGFDGIKFGLFFKHCLKEHEAICLGLYRYAQEEPNHPYVFTNPHPKERILKGDHAFFLALPGFKLTNEDGPLAQAYGAAAEAEAETTDTQISVKLHTKADRQHETEMQTYSTTTTVQSV